MEVKLEICAGSIHDFEEVQDLAVDRFELNSAVELGGLSADVETLKAAKKITDKPIIAMLRCRPGNFIYSLAELKIMYAQAAKLIENGADGLAFGFLNKDHQLDIEAIKHLKSIAKDKELVFHRAIDSVDDKSEALTRLCELGIKRCLLMGLASEDFKICIQRIARLQKEFGTKIELMPGGGVKEDNILAIIEKTKVNNIHGSFKRQVIDPKTLEGYNLVDRKRVEQVLKLLQK